MITVKRAQRVNFDIRDMLRIQPDGVSKKEQF